MRASRNAAIAAMLRDQNHNLRQSITGEFSRLRAAAYPVYTAAMSNYRRELMAALDTNDEVLASVFGPPADDLISRCRLLWHQTRGEAHVYDGLGSLWRHCAKDWSSAGAAGQAGLRERITTATLAERTRLPADERLLVCIPGCGQARLAYSVADALRGGGEVTAFDTSEASLGFARRMLGATQCEELTFHPFLDSFSNNWDAATRTASVSVPDIVCAGTEARVAAADATLRHPSHTHTHARAHVRKGRCVLSPLAEAERLHAGGRRADAARRRLSTREPSAAIQRHRHILLPRLRGGRPAGSRAGGA